MIGHFFSYYADDFHQGQYEELWCGTSKGVFLTVMALIVLIIGGTVIYLKLMLDIGGAKAASASAVGSASAVAGLLSPRQARSCRRTPSLAKSGIADYLRCPQSTGRPQEAASTTYQGGIINHGYNHSI